MTILGIETSHDDTSIAVVLDGKVLDLWTISQIDIFKKYGGTIPEISSREHVKNIAIIQEMVFSKYNKDDFDYIAYTTEPGLIGTLQVGYLFAYAISKVCKKPLIPVNHLVGHFLSSTLTENIEFPALCLLVSGGHTQLIYAKNVADLEIIGETLDDAVGEAFDKVSSRLGLGFPGGPLIDKLSQTYQGDYETFTKPHTTNLLDFSFSGLKTQVLNRVNKAAMKNETIDPIKLAVSFQSTAVEYLIDKTKLALEQYPNIKTLVLGGGVSANTMLRNEFVKLHPNTIVPSLKYATDNGAMIAQAAYLKLKFEEDNK
ncbi:tRNA (adenosine(37)-N6)-threonylcarbamoyltransferase complex transferase subunit TsaD [Mycoplasma sp. Pen4]|uniref:tRNA (adenosine(37)-N6)-threonylcarbamoyltransferase complex transferase subunit TsaD n=1 Tax=Mycoplasma sp. Pen4 TaxID=640330 RepID=UPI00165477C3|nr:tRNA (adenosine(37)-N6)-threonylcarbamoyltransferase complex transferase subunit TsaD [Mycoplasma sp. Pen4]QNM93946.1 tRNA (adenosine(37)-N6)-threonylcarbamoyltransferase complex transferase subunit TsaD [Mycoplasma sp. Pen4]